MVPLLFLCVSIIMVEKIYNCIELKARLCNEIHVSA